MIISVSTTLTKACHVCHSISHETSDFKAYCVPLYSENNIFKIKCNLDVSKKSKTINNNAQNFVMGKTKPLTFRAESIHIRKFISWTHAHPSCYV
jgi:hypothetical protein